MSPSTIKEGGDHLTPLIINSNGLKWLPFKKKKFDYPSFAPSVPKLHSYKNYSHFGIEYRHQRKMHFFESIFITSIMSYLSLFLILDLP